MSRKKIQTIEEVDRAARAHNMRYADTQKKETLEKIEPIRRIPEGYRKAGEWREEKDAESKRT